LEAVMLADEGAYTEALQALTASNDKKDEKNGTSVTVHQLFSRALAVRCSN
jgi:hypothetical protein